MNAIRENLRWLDRHFNRPAVRRANRRGNAKGKSQSGVFTLEALEQRVLLSADALAPGMTGVLQNGLITAGDTMLDIIATGPAFDTPIPGVLQSNHDVNGAGQNDGMPNGTVDDKDLHTPDVRDMLSINVDRQHPIGTISSLGASVDKSDVMDVFRYVNGEKGGLNVFESVEQSLRAMDLNSATTADNITDYKEMYNVLVVGAISDFLADSNPADFATLEAGFSFFLLFLSEPTHLSGLIDLNLSGIANHSDADNFSFSFTVNLTVRDQYLIDLGLESDLNEIILPEKVFTTGPALADSPNGPRHVGLNASISLPVRFSLNIADAVAPEDFRFAIPGSMAVEVSDSFAGDSGETLNDLIVNVGFLGTEVPGPDNASKFNLHMDWTVTLSDPSSPDHLGFTQSFPATSTGGVLTASTPLPNDPGEEFVFPQDVGFKIRVGGLTTSHTADVTVTAGSTTGNSSADDLRDSVQTALNNAGLGGLITAGLTGSDRLTLSLPSTNITPLGYASNQLSGTTLDAANAPSGLGSTTEATIRFLLSVDGVLPTLIDVMTTPGDDDPDGMGGTGDEGQLSIEGLIIDLNVALSAAGIVGVTATNNGGKVRISSASQLEVTRTIRLDADELITVEELTHESFPEFIAAEQDDANAKFQIVMPLDVRDGVDFGPTGNPGIRVDVNPFDFTAADLKGDSAGVQRLTLPLLDLDGVNPLADEEPGHSDFIQYLDFNVVGAGEALGMIQQLEGWLKQLRNTDLLGAFNIPFAEAVLGNLLAFDDLLHDLLLVDDLDNDDVADDLGRLLAKNLDPDSPDSFLASFGTAQELGARLDALFSPSILTQTSANSDGDNDDDYAAYDKDTKQLTYHISLSHLFVSENVGSDFTSNLDLSPVLNLSTQSKVHLQATGNFDAILGMELGPGRIDNGTMLDLLNGGIGANIAEGIAFTGAGDVRVVEGRLSADATFDVTVRTGSGTTLARVVVTKASTAGNTELAHLVTDINSALQTALLLPLPTAPAMPTVVNLHDRIEAAIELGRVVLRAVSGAGVEAFNVNSSTANASYSQLGLASTTATTVFGSTMPSSAKVTSDVTVNFYTNGGGSAAASILLRAGSVGPAGTGEALTGGNLNLTDLVNDINQALLDTALAGKVIAARSGSTVYFLGIDSSVQSIRVEGVGGAKTQIGLGSDVVAGVFVVAAADTNAQDIANVFGKLTTTANFEISLNGGMFKPLMVEANSTNDNSSILDLIANINAVIQLDGDLMDKVEAFAVDTFRIGFRAIDDDVLSFQVRASDADSAVTQMGLANGTLTADATIRVTALKRAPFFVGPSTNAVFTVSVTTNPGMVVTEKTVTLLTNDTLTNQTIQDLVGDLRRALDIAFGSVSANPLLVSNDGNRILLKPKSSAVIAFTLTAPAGSPAITDLKLYQAGTTVPAIGDVISSADTADILIHTGSNQVYRVTLDGQTTIGGVLGVLNTLTPLGADPAVPITASINAIAAGLNLKDNTSGTALFRVDSVNGSHAAQALGIFGADTDINHPIPDDLINGTRIATKQLADRFFLRQVDASTPLLSADVTVGAAKFDGSSGSVVNAGDDSITIPGHGYVTGDPVVYRHGGGSNVGGLTNGATYYVISVDDNTLKLASSLENATGNSPVGISGVGGGTAHRLQSLVSIEASFGFVGIALTGSGFASGEFGISLNDTSNTAKVTLASLLKSLSKDQDTDGDVDMFDVATLVSLPTLTLSGDLELGVALKPGADIIDLGTTPKITLHLNGPGNPFALKAGAIAPYDVTDLVASNPANAGFANTLPDVDVNLSDLSTLLNFQNIEFSDVMVALKGVRDFLNQFAAFDFLKTEMPLIGLSFNDLVNLAERFSKAVEEIEKNPAAAIQDVEQKIRETFGLPPGGASIFSLSLVDNNAGGDPTPSSKDMLKVSLNLPKSFNKALPIDLDLSDEYPELPFSLLGSAGLSASGFLNAKLAFGVDLDDPTNPDKLVLFTDESDTSISGNLAASADNVTLNAALGPLGVFIAGGNVGINLDFSYKNASANPGDRIVIADLFAEDLGGFTAALTGAVDATLPVFFPTQSTFVGDIQFGATLSVVQGSPDFHLVPAGSLPGGALLSIPDEILNLDFANFDLLGNLPLMIEAGDLFLAGLQDILDGNVFGFKLPLIGDKLADGARFIEEFRKEFVQPLRDLVENAPEKTEMLIKQYLFQVISATGLLQDSGNGGGITADDIVITGDPFGTKTPGDDSDDDFIQFNFVLGQTYTPNVNLNIDLGFPGLNFQANGELGITVGWNLGVGFGISLEEGAYVDIARDNDTEAADLRVFVDANIGTTTLSGTLGFLQLVISPLNTNFDGVGPEYADPDGPGGPAQADTANDPTKFHAEFGVNILNSSSVLDKHLSFFELGSLGAKISAMADAEVNLQIVAQLDPSLVPATISAALPKVKAQFVLDWGFTSDDLITDGIDLGDSLNLVEFRDVGLDLGSFIGETVGPIVAKIQEITGPLQPIVDIVTARIPVLSDLAGRTITLADIAAAFGEFDPALIYAIADIITLVNTIETGAGESLFITLGSFTLVDKDDPTALLGGGDLANPNFNIGGVSDANILAKIPGLGDLTDAANLDALLGGDSDAPAATSTKSLFSGGFSSTPGSSGFAFPIFEHPEQIFGLLLGKNATLITYDLPPFVMDFKWEVSFPIYGPLWGVVSAGVGMKIDLAFGYDTQGIRDFADGGFQNPLDLLSGFYISDTNMPDGSFGVDVPELTFSGSIGVGAELNAGIASAGVTANIILTVNFDLYDPNHDGKVRISELVSTFLFEARNGDPLLAPIAIFDVGGNIAFQLSAYIKFLFAKFSFDITPPIVLFEFSIPFEREPILATERGDGSVLLNIGPNAAARQNGDVRDISEEIFVKDASGGKVAVWSPKLGVPESAAQLYTIGGSNPVVTGFGGEGDDMIDASGLSAYAAILEGGSGNDTLKGGENKDTLKGDAGDDIIEANGGDDVVYGGEGNDNIKGGEDDDILFGDSGAISLDAMTGSIRSTIGLKDGEDTINGGTGSDIIFGGGGNDSIGGDDDPSLLDAGGTTDGDVIFGDSGRIEAPGGVANLAKVTNVDGTITYTFISLSDRAGGGNDTIRGQGGLDAIFGGSGNDDIDGGEQDDILYGESGFDLISGGGHADTIMGGTEDDRIFGFRDEMYVGAPDGGDTIFGQQGNDFIRGNQGDDIIHGNAGADIIFGDYGDDTIYGENEPDLIFGGPGRDYIEGGTGNDVIFGDDGIAVWVDFYGAGTHKVIGLVANIADVQNLNDAALTAIPHTGDILTTDDGNPLTQDLLLTEVNGATDGNDRIIGGEGDDIVFGGADALFDGVKGDTIFGDFDPGAVPGTPPTGPIPSGQDILIGDGGRVQFFERRRDNIRTVVGTSAAEVGDDTILGNGGNDVIFGSGAADTLYGRMAANYTNPALNEAADVRDDDVIVGDDGEIDYDGSTGIIQRIFTYHDAAAIAVGGIDHAFGNKHDDIIFGGITGDFLKGDDGLDGDDIIFGDNGEIVFGLDDDLITTQIARLFTTDIIEGSGGADVIEGQDDNDIILGGVNNGGVDMLYGDSATPTAGSIAVDGNDIILGDNGILRWDLDADLDTLDLISSDTLGLGGTDEISGNKGNDVLIGSTGGDIMYGDDASASAGANDGEDVMLGDNGDITLLGTTGRIIVRGTAVDLITTTDTVETSGGADTISGNAKTDVVLGGVNNGGQDIIYGDRSAPTAASINNDGEDILLGDNGLLDFTFGSDTNRFTLDLIRSFEDDGGGVDLISGNKGADVAIGGTGGDFIFGDDTMFTAAANDLADILLGDNADIFLVDPEGASGGDLKLVLSAAVLLIRTTDEEHPEYGGADTIAGNAGSDIIAGGVQGDFLYGDRPMPTVATTANEGDDIILGDNGALEWLSDGRLSEITGIDIEENNAALWAKYGEAESDADLTTLDLITTEQPNNGGRDLIYGDAGEDFVFGGTDSDEIHGDDGNEEGDAGNRDVLFGDHGRIYPQFSTLDGFNSRNFFSIDVGDGDGGEGDRMWGEEGDDVMLGQQGDDRMWGGSGNDDMAGGHNVAGGYDELTMGAINASLNPAIGVPPISSVNDLMDGGSGNDAMAGDNAIIWRRGDDLSRRFRELTESTIYSTTNSTITANVGPSAESDPNDAVGRDIELLDHSDDVQADPLGRFGADVMAGGADGDVMFGQLGNDLLQGDGFIQIVGLGDAVPTTRQMDVTDSGVPSTAGSLFFKVPEQVTDGDDYIEGNGGDDLIYGGLGQDDIIGGSSELFGLVTEDLRPDGSDWIFGGAGIDISRNNIGDATEDGTTHLITTGATGHSRDADYIMGDNANVFRLVQGGASGTNHNDPADVFLTFAYDNYAGGLRIVPRAMQQLDYTLGGADYHGGTYVNGAAQLDGQPADNGAGDLIHGESGDDIIFAMTGSDIVFGEGQDDDIIGGYGHDWISGGTGQDGVVGDDGLLYTSRNGTAEALYNIAATSQEIISTPGQIQYAVINVTGELKKTADLVPFSFDSSWNANDDEFPDNANTSPFADDIIFGGLGSDFVHGGSGDDAMSGAEALEHAYVPVYNGNGDPIGTLDLGYLAVGFPSTVNPGNVLAFQPEDLDGQHLNNRFRAGEFRLYDEYDPRRTILLTLGGEASKTGAGLEFLLNFDESEGVLRPGGSTGGNKNQSVPYPAVNDDGADVLFGDLGNDWIVGGTGRDNSYGGWGNDLLNADDNHNTNIGLNDQPDTHPTYEDRAYGGAGRDVLIGNTGGDRLIDWVGEYNSYLVPYAPFGQASVSRTLQPFLPEFLYKLSAADGADPTRNHDTGADPLRNGEPDGELGLVLQKDNAWQDQTGAPADPQAGNIPGGPRDVLRSADFNAGNANGFLAATGSWSVERNRYQVAPAVQGGDAVSVFYVDSYIPSYFEMQATINAVKPTGGWNANAYLVFDYQSASDFKFAGINASTNKIEIGHRGVGGWIVDHQIPYTSQIKSGADYNVFLSLHGTTATLVVNNQTSATFTFAPRTDAYGMVHGLNAGMVGLGARNGRAEIDNVSVQRLAPITTLDITVDFSAGTGTLLQSATLGEWSLAGGRYGVASSGQTTAISPFAIKLNSSAYVDVAASLRTSGEAGFVFDQYAPDDFKFVSYSVATKQIIMGHRTAKGWFVDAVFSHAGLTAGVDYRLGMTLKGTTVSVTLNSQTVMSRSYNAMVTDGGLGLLSHAGTSSFDWISLKTDDPAFQSV